MEEIRQAEPVRADVYVTLTEEELYRALQDETPRKAGKLRLKIQTVLLILVAVWCLVPLFFDGTPDITLCGVAVAVCVAMWLVPPLKQRSDARAMAAQQATFRLRLYETGVGFGEEPTLVRWDEMQTIVSEQQMTVIVERDCLVIPRRVLTEETWQWLLNQGNKGDVGHDGTNK